MGSLRSRWSGQFQFIMDNLQDELYDLSGLFQLIDRLLNQLPQQIIPISRPSESIARAIPINSVSNQLSRQF